MSMYSKRSMGRSSNSAKDRLKVLIVCHDRYLSGANRSLVDWLTGRDREQADITVLIPRTDKEFSSMLAKLGCKVWSAPYVLSIKPLDKKDMVWNIKNTIKIMWSVTVQPFIAKCMSYKAKRSGIDIVHSNSFATTFGAEIARYSGIPHIWHIREFCEADHGFTHLRVAQCSEYCEHSHAIFISDSVASYQLRRYKFKSYFILYNKVKYDPNIKSTRSFMEDGVCNIIIVGTVSEGKGQAEAIRAVRKLHDGGSRVRLYICGQGSRDAIRSELSDPGDFIEDLGYREDVNNIRTRMDIALVCSRMEAFGRVTVEAQYYGNIVIGADSGCTPYLVDDGETGFLYEWGDVDSLAGKIRYCMEKPELMKAIKNKAREVAVQKYSKDISNNIYNIYSNVAIWESSNNLS